MPEDANYYSILTASVRYDKRLKPNEKLLYSEITALTFKDGYCFAGNRYFADLYGVTKETVSSWIRDLKDCGYIVVKIYRDKNNAFQQRRIYPLSHKGEVLRKILIPYKEKDEYPIKKKVKENNTSKNNTSKNINNKSSSKEERIPYEKIINYLNEKTDRHFNYKTASYRKLIRSLWINGKYRFKDFKAVIDNKAYSWQNTKMWKYMRPSTLFRASKFDEYLNENSLDNGQPRARPSGQGFPNANEVGDDGFDDKNIPF